MYLEVDARMRSLNGVARQVRAEAGGNGSTNCKAGANGRDAVIRVPPGTVVSSITSATNSSEDDDLFEDEQEDIKLNTPRKKLDVTHIVDLDADGQRFLLVKGGKGGRGNASFASSTNRSPRHATEGEVPSPQTVLLELKSIADVGLVGFPNAGKSSILYTVSNASPKIAAYPFTTLHPSVGQVKFDDYSTFTVCDIPGLLEGAHLNKGLGHEFLRHIERTHVLAFVLDASEGDPCDALRILEAELTAYDPTMLKTKECVVIANKCDAETSKPLVRRIKTMLQRRTKQIPLFCVSAKEREGFEPLLLALREKVLKSKQ